VVRAKCGYPAIDILIAFVYSWIPFLSQKISLLKKKVGFGRYMGQKKDIINAVVANPAGEIFDLEGFGAAGMSGRRKLIPLTFRNTIAVPHGGEFMFLPDRAPIVYHWDSGRFETLWENPYVPGEPVFPVAVFNSPGYVISSTTAYEENEDAGFLPLFSYGAAGWHGNGFRTTAVRVETERRQDLRLMQEHKVRAGVNWMRKRMPDNRLRAHLEKCALTYGCPAGKNFFLRRFEAPLPTSRACNARCLGCISLQQGGDIPNSQDRIDFTPTSDEIAQVALEHIHGVKRSVVSFGQGCEGDPLFAADAIIPGIRKIRSDTARGTVNLNTNGSRPGVLEKMFDAGLDSMRVSMNSVREKYYTTYFRPMDYAFSDVIEGIDLALERGKFVAINYLNLPGFTDTPEEVEALMDFLEHHPINMIQWRNLNFDPLRYCEIMDGVGKHGTPMGMKHVLKQVRKKFPDLKFGYFNPPHEKFKRAKAKV
jgi:pyruvate-formate lyase-activating enzyme